MNDKSIDENAMQSPVDTKGEEPEGLSSQDDSEEAAGRIIRISGASIAVVLLLSLLWYLAADRFTPYTTQARIGGYVVGVAPKIAGLVTQVWVKNNQQVAKGDRLFEIDASQYQIAVDRASSDLENTARQVNAGSAAVEAARATLRATEANELKTKQDLDRLTRLYDDDRGTISVRRLEISQASLDQAKAQVRVAEADVKRAIEQMGGDGEDNTLLKTAQTGVEKAQLDLANSVVQASTAGIITNLRAEIGQFAGAGNPVLTLIAINDVWINAEFTENNLGNISEGTPVEILFDVLPGEVFKGQIRSIGLGISSGKEPPPGTLPTIQNNRDWLRQSQRFPVIISFDPNQNSELRRHLRLGGQASVMAYSNDTGLLTWLGEAYIRISSWFSYAY
ncbi:MAG: HlyD family secretion protein [Gammaproteobacteria bacterium]|jgi:multidrug resistance efflux pump|nr:HlyD family secretion protein [Gammaproteobacteria bacterium]MBT5202501.1 HlyD family secretion protein [Gammaproteobacteria bacterium]MBT5601474.1 HlyD family secretion protein [Gammaproteobacteria bacterium]MBT6246997.1 HlyD family secretion protein [Gammaproteobacteria bacterium]